jgi:translocator protein
MKILKLIMSVGVSLMAGAIGSTATRDAVPNWYAGLNKPFFNPPSWVFGPVWSLLYILMGVSLFLVWTSDIQKSKVRAYTAFGVQLVLNTSWSLVFFGLQAPWAAVFVIGALLAAITWTAWEFWRFSRMAVYLLIPYVLWVLFATALNVSIALLN